jgi:hypothetical protein
MVKFYEKLWLLKKITNYWHLNFLLLIAPTRGWHLWIGLNSIFSTLPQSEYTSRAVSTPCMRYIRACVYFCLLSIRCFNVVQPEMRFHFQLANQIAKKIQIFHIKVQNFQKNSKFHIVFENFIASVRNLMIANWVYWRRVSGSNKRILAIIKSTIDAVTFSNTIKLSPF